ncbi:putative bifunctional diguanylate cyclase/phosphodiesterase [Hephaestia sp. GCM10023244]|uniref:putative bifunctional diguanylate cyclase/phosphodiesterase n=1 Tax=unclassified Hephaestia TaxID=2631281 RepID=UPI002077080D|nr:EAL domain-containing protein [Hephaestia sp. MAHUQ-44]MCM8731769.1 EAL domain-containing protein [Hephaestia sp. MAHUQ-44]
MTDSVRRAMNIAATARENSVLLSLVDPDETTSAFDHVQPVRQVGAVWPLAMIAQIVAVTACLAITIEAGYGALAAQMIVPGGLATAAGVIVFAVLLIGRWRGFAPHIQARAIACGAVAIAASLLYLLHATAALPPGPLQLAGFVAVAGAIGLSASALFAIRAAILGFAIGLAAAIFALSGLSVATGLALGLLVCLGLVTHRLAALDHRIADERAARDNAGRLASRLVAEFESHGSGWFWQTDRQGRLTYLSDKVARALVVDGASPIGRMLNAVFRMDGSTRETERTLGFHLNSRTAFAEYSVAANNKAEADRWWSISGRPVTDDRGRFVGFIGSGSDLTEQRRSEEEITRLARFDGLTGLANRQRMKHSLDQTLAHSARTYHPTTLFLLDLDRFKAVNDTLGHQTGDELLKQVAQRLQRAIGDKGLVGRLGGDEFEVVLPGETNRERLGELAKSVIGALSQPYFIGGSSISIGCSIGIAIAPEDGDDSESLIRNADLALYAAKADGRGIHRFYRAELLAGAQNRKALEDDLRHALVQNQFYVAYQPVVSTREERIVGYEALIRWEHPTRGAISPAEFVPIAEECGLIESIGEWVLRTACDEAARWPDHVRVAVNVSPIQFANPALPAIVTNALAKSGIAPQRLELEITEGVFLDETASSDQMFKNLKAIGVRLALDDFGTGYSSLGYLKKAPFDKIKIDQSFVRGAAIPGNRNAAIIKAIVTLAETLGMETTAEGVELEDEIALIRNLGCSHIQGYIYGKPARCDEVRKQLGGGGKARAMGYKVSRSPRTRMLRSARIEVAGEVGEVRIRDLSATGAMIEGVDASEDAIGIELLIELLEGEMFPARLRWAAEGKAGIEFNKHFNMERLNQPAPKALRKAG